jgi:WD repeat and SOF domain-containing protein 1
VRSRRLRLFVLNPSRLHQFSVARFGKKRGPFVLSLSLFLILFVVFALTKRFATRTKQWPLAPGEPSTLVFRRQDLQRIWKWEIASGHYPSRRESQSLASVSPLRF